MTFDETIKECGNNAESWKCIIEKHRQQRVLQIELQQHIQKAMIEYLKTVGDTEDFTLTYHEFGEIKLCCNGDLFDLEQIEGFCDVFGLEILISNRAVIEDYMAAITKISCAFLFTTKHNIEKGGPANG